MIRGLAIGGVLGCLLTMFFIDLGEQARATYAIAVGVFLLVLTLTPKAAQNTQNRP